MENENKTKKTEQRVVLNLSMNQANDLYEWLRNSRSELIGPDAKIEIVDRITTRLQKTITKHENSEGCELAEAMGVTGPEGA